MPIENIIEKFAIIVPSCDRYSDLWEPFFYLFWKNWDDCPFKLYLLTNNLNYFHPKVNLLKLGKDVSWSKNLKKGLSQIKEDYILMLIEDLFIVEKVNSINILSLVKNIYKNNYNYLRLNPYPKPDISVNQSIGSIKKGSAYRTSTPFSFWKKEILMDLLIDHESAWDFEIKGSERSDKYDDFFSVYNRYFEFIHGVRKGRWDRNSVKKMKALGISLDLNSRGIMTKLEYAKNKVVNLIHSTVVGLFPEKLKITILKRVYKKK